MQSCIWVNHRRLEQCILDRLNWRCLKKKYAQAAKPNRAHQHKRLIPTVKRGAGGGRSVAAGPGHLSFTEFFVNFSAFWSVPVPKYGDTGKKKKKKSQCWSREQEPMTFPDSHIFSSTTRGAGARIVPLGTLNSLCGPIFFSRRHFQTMFTPFYRFNLSEIWLGQNKPARPLQSTHQQTTIVGKNDHEDWSRDSLHNADVKHVIRASYRQQRYAEIQL